MNETIFKRDVKQQTTNQSIVTNELPQSSKDQCENLIIQLSNRMYSMVIEIFTLHIMHAEIIVIPI